MNRLKKTLPFIFLIITTGKLFAQNNDLSIGFKMDSGVLNGSIKEYVFDFDDDGKSFVLSRLDWDIKNICFFGFHSDLNYKHFHTDIAFKAGSPGTCGFMNDYDWLDISDHSLLTNHSWHTNNFNSLSQINFNVGFNFFLPAKITLTPLLGFEAEYISFTGTGGAYKYLNSDGRTFSKGVFTGDVISYKQDFTTFKIGFLAETNVIPHIDLNLHLFVCPFFNINGYDFHIKRNIYFWDKMENGVMFEGNADIACIFLKDKVSFGINGGFQYIPRMHGDTYSHGKNTSVWVYSYSLGGTDRFLWNIGASLRLAI